MKTYPHDRFLAKTILPWIPPYILPNHLTILRLLLTPVVIWLVAGEHYRVGIPFFLAVAFTDALDGSLARTRNCVTDWGKVWDPVADKILIGSVAVILLYRDFPGELIIPILGLEAMFLTGGYFWKKRGRIVSANIWGKLKMNCQVAGVTLYMYSLVYHSPSLAIASYAILGVAAVLALISLFTKSA